MATLRVVLDTNVLLSGIAYPASIPGKIITAWRHGSIDVLLSTFILEELQRMLPKLTHRHGLTPAEISDLVDALFIQAEVIDPPADIEPNLRDINDQPVLAGLKVSGADYLISGDKDLLALADAYPIVSPSAFWTAHGGL
jgi:putative PIN family toxin of toxin-antitoxin system